MAQVRGACRTCGEVELPASSVVVLRCEDEERTAYRFTCPSCSATVLREVAAHIAALLVSSGADQEPWHSHPSMAPPRHVGLPPVTEADVEAFVAALDRDDWIERLLEAGGER